MVLFWISIPLMVLGVLIAAGPLVVAIRRGLGQPPRAAERQAVGEPASASFGSDDRPDGPAREVA